MLSVLINTEGMRDSGFMTYVFYVTAVLMPGMRNVLHVWWQRRPLKWLPRGWREHNITQERS